MLYEDTGQINFYFIYIILKNMFYDLKRKEGKFSVIPIKNLDITNEEYNINNRYLKISKQDQKEIYLKHKVIEDYLLDDDFLDLIADGVIDDYSNKKFGAFYKRKLFEEVFIKGNSIRKFSNDSGITYYSVYNTIKNIKKELNEIYKNRRLDIIHNQMDGNKMDSKENLGE